MINDMISKIDFQISTIHKSKSDLDYQYNVLKDKCTKIKSFAQDLFKVFKSVEQIYQSIESNKAQI